MSPTVMATCSSLRILVGVLGCIVAVTASPHARAASNGDEDGGTEATDSESAESEEVATNVPEKKTVGPKDTSFGHKGQFNVRLALGAAYRVVMRYDESPACSTAVDDDGNPVKMCGYGSPAMLDTAVGYATSAGLEPFVWGRFGLMRESNSNTAALVILGAGARIYTMSDAPFKFFIEPALGIELEKASPTTYERMYEYKQDLILRLGIGPQYDFSRNFGAYAAGGLTVGVFRAIQSWLDLHIGVQARFP